MNEKPVDCYILLWENITLSRAKQIDLRTFLTVCDTPEKAKQAADNYHAEYRSTEPLVWTPINIGISGGWEAETDVTILKSKSRCRYEIISWHMNLGAEAQEAGR